MKYKRMDKAEHIIEEEDRMVHTTALFTLNREQNAINAADSSMPIQSQFGEAMSKKFKNFMETLNPEKADLPVNNKINNAQTQSKQFG